MLTAAKYAKMGEELMSFTKELLHSQMHAVAQTISTGPTVSLPRQGESSGSEAERAVEFLPVLPAAPLLCNSKQYELRI